MKENARRLSKYAAKTDGSVTGKRFEATRKSGKAAYSYYAEVQARIEATVKVICQGVSVVLLPRYMNYALELYKKSSDQERRVTYDKWRARGLLGATLRAISTAVCSWTPAPDVMDVLAQNDIRYAQKSGAVYNTVWTTASVPPAVPGVYFQVWNSNNGGTYYISRSYLSFDTSPLGPGALVLGATLRVKCRGNTPAAPFDVVAQTSNSNHPHYPAIAADFDKGLYTFTLGSAPSSALVVGQWVDMVLNSAGVAHVNLTGETHLALRASTDVSGSAPAAHYSLNFYRTPGSANEHPHLLVSYYPD